jgi:hypothetical protein
MANILKLKPKSGVNERPASFYYNDKEEFVKKTMDFEFESAEGVPVYGRVAVVKEGVFVSLSDKSHPTEERVVSTVGVMDHDVISVTWDAVNREYPVATVRAFNLKDIDNFIAPPIQEKGV